MLSQKFDAIVRALPNDHEKTMFALQEKLSDEQICEALDAPSCAKNKAIVKCLMDKVKSKEDADEFCDCIERITSFQAGPSDIPEIVAEIRTGKLLWMFHYNTSIYCH